MIPQVTITKGDGNTGVVRPGSVGVLAIIASAAAGPVNTPSTYTRPSDVVADFGYGRLASYCAHALDVTKNPVLAIRPVSSTAGAYGAFALAGTGTSVPTGTGNPFDTLSVSILVTAGCTIGITGGAYQVSLDGGLTYGPTTALGAANSIAIARTGIAVALAAGTLVAGDVITFTSTAPVPTTADLVASLEALRVTSQPWDVLLVDSVGSSTIVSQLEAWLLALEAVGIFRTAIVNLRVKNVGESEAAYLAAMTTVVASASGIRVLVGYDGGDAVDKFLGVRVARPAALHAAARAESISIGTDLAYKALGPLANCSIQDQRSNPKFHDEMIFPGGDAIRCVTLRTFPGEAGSFICNANLLAPAGSDFVYWQHARVLNRGAEIAFQILTNALSKGVQKSSKAGPNGERYIAEQDASLIEALVNAGLTAPMNGQVSDIRFVLSRTDDISSNAGATINCELRVVGLAYVKKFAVTAQFVKSI